MVANKRVSLTRDDWAAAALDALAEGGLASIAVEPLAGRLGATKGSFYWHFRDRGALVDAALELWERQDTEGVIAMLEQLPEPLARMRALFALTHPADSRFGVEAVLLAEADDPQIKPVLRRVTGRRVGYMVDTLRVLGLPEQEARHRALLAYQTWIGYMQLQRATPNIMPRGAGRDEYLQHVLQVIEGGWDDAKPPQPA